MRIVKLKTRVHLLPLALLSLLFTSLSSANTLESSPDDTRQIKCSFSPHLSCRDTQNETLLWYNSTYKDPARFVVAGSRLFISHSTTTASYDLVTGQRRWQAGSHSDAHYFYPVVSGQDVYLARSDGRLEKRRADSGAIVWSRSLAQGWVYPPVIVQNTILTGGQNRTIWVLDSQSGKTRHSIRLDQELVAPLFQVENTVIASTFDNQLSAYRVNYESGKTTPIWRIRLDAPAFSYLTSTGHLVTADMGGNLNAIDPETGRLRWQKTVHDNALFWNVLHAQKLISLTDSGALMILDVGSGEVQNRLQFDRSYMQPPIVHGEHIALYDIHGTVQHITNAMLDARPNQGQPLLVLNRGY